MHAKNTCRACGLTGLKGKGRRYCDACRAKGFGGDHGTKNIRPCQGCGGPKPRGCGRRYCDGCARMHEVEGYQRHYTLRTRYGLTPSDYSDMLAAQGGRCAICGVLAEDASRGYLVVDHDHSTGAVRSLLCDLCNRGLGMFRDDSGLLRAAARYLGAA